MPAHLCRFAGDLRSLAFTELGGRELYHLSCRPIAPSSQPPTFVLCINFLTFLAGRDTHDLDGVADYVGRALLAARPARHPQLLCAIQRRHAQDIPDGALGLRMAERQVCQAYLAYIQSARDSHPSQPAPWLVPGWPIAPIFAIAASMYLAPNR